MVGWFGRLLFGSRLAAAMVLLIIISQHVKLKEEEARNWLCVSVKTTSLVMNYETTKVDSLHGG